MVDKEDFPVRGLKHHRSLGACSSSASRQRGFPRQGGQDKTICQIEIRNKTEVASQMKICRRNEGLASKNERNAEVVVGKGRGGCRRVGVKRFCGLCDRKKAQADAASQRFESLTDRRLARSKISCKLPVRLSLPVAQFQHRTLIYIVMPQAAKRKGEGTTPSIVPTLLCVPRRVASHAVCLTNEK